jgi:DNA-binding transcriptional ArsR family regulator
MLTVYGFDYHTQMWCRAGNLSNRVSPWATGQFSLAARRKSQEFEELCLRRKWRFHILNHMVKCNARSLNRTFAALADPTRRRILQHLAHGDRCVTDLARPYSMSLPAVSKHLRVLENAGLIRRRRKGRVHSLKLEVAPMRQASRWIEEYRRFWEANLDRLDEYLKELQATEKKHDH